MIVTDKVGRTWREELERVRGFIGCRIVREEWEIPKEGRDPPPSPAQGSEGSAPRVRHTPHPTNGNATWRARPREGSGGTRGGGASLCRESDYGGN